MFNIAIYLSTIYRKIKKGGDNGLFITLVPKVL